jgi:hypothetical protein
MNHPFAPYQRATFFRGWCLALVLCGLVPLGLAAPSKTPDKAAGPAAAKTAPTNAPPTVVIIPKSVFISDPLKAGKDPFYPNARRLGPPKPTPQAPEVAPAVTASPSTLLKVDGVLKGSKNRRMAIINDEQFYVGTSNQMTLSGRARWVKCVEIRDDAVIVTVDNERYELKIPVE